MPDRRLIEVAFPLRQASLDSVHEKNVRHGHISTLHIWPARRPLAACRAALVATLLPDPGTDEARKDLVVRLGGRLGKDDEGKPITTGGILRWKREYSEDLQWFRDEIRKTYGGRAPRVLDPFAGGGAIPLEAMRLGCEAIAADINPVAWFILKCTLEYPQRLAGQQWRLPDFAWKDAGFREEWKKGPGKTTKKGRSQREDSTDRTPIAPPATSDSVTDVGAQVEMGFKDPVPDADLSWHVRAWGRWVLAKARADLDRFYPTWIALQHSKTGLVTEEVLLTPGEDAGRACGTRNLERQKSKADEDGFEWVPKPAVAYLWARTVPCKKCRAEVPLLKTRWLCRKVGRRIRLTMSVVEDPGASGGKRVEFGVEAGVPASVGSVAERRAAEKEIGGGTMSRTGVVCPCCHASMTMEDIRLRGRDGKLGVVMTAVVVDGSKGKEYRLPRDEERAAIKEAETAMDGVFACVPFGLPREPIASGDALGMRVPLYGFDQWHKLFTRRQLVALGTFVKHTRAAKETMEEEGYPVGWAEAIGAYLGIVFDRTANYMSTICIWESVAEEIKQTFLRFALPITWDFSEANPLSNVDRFYVGAISNVVNCLENLLTAAASTPIPQVLNRSAIQGLDQQIDVVVTDPPYYDAIPYSDLMDFFYLWLRRITSGWSPTFDAAFKGETAPKWSHNDEDGELIDESSRHANDAEASRKAYENGMFRAFQACNRMLTAAGRMVVVFANKQPAAWAALASAVIRAGWVVTGSWPIATEMTGGVRNHGRASLASSVWLVCRKRPPTRNGFDQIVLDEMRTNITESLRRFWDDGIRGPDFVWAATGPALEAYSKYPKVIKADSPNETMTVSEFLTHARRIVVEFVVGEVFREVGGQADGSCLDPVTTYWILHRRTFGLEEVPIGPVILYAVSCGLSDRELIDTYEILHLKGSASADEDDEGEPEVEEEEEGGKGAKVSLRPWDRRTRRGLGETAPSGKPVPVIDKLHRTLQLWKTGEVADVDRYAERQGLSRDTTFRRVLQVAIELSAPGSDERAILEALSNHLGVERFTSQMPLMGETPE